MGVIEAGLLRDNPDYAMRTKPYTAPPGSLYLDKYGNLKYKKSIFS